ncbi:hypothetical protein [Burkholderia sp. JKS000303]|uniref:hypothetical protein n=1 Tax=Burkholderia sp. JKS000303 TaxID=1938747 RepID=UPI000C01319D|nr:hypothetical protein [Burkholderia sp. JKS000303]PFH29101.1 hypothetical protein BX604_2873 [Burkholderia sp. JKS000303]
MRVTKASHRAARKSLDGHIRFLGFDGRTYQVLTLHDLPQCRAMRIEAAYSGGRMVRPR